MMTPQPLFKLPCSCGEGPVWHSGKLHWVDIENRLIHRGDPATRRLDTIQPPSRPGFIVPRAKGGWIVGLEDGLYSLADDWTDGAVPEMKLLCPIEADRPDLRLNDGKPDPVGRLWCGSLSLKDETEQSALYRVEADLRPVRVIDRVSVSNGLAWSLDGATMYYIDSPTRSLDAFDYNLKTADIANRRSIHRFTEKDGWPDGMAADADGNLWIALWDGHAVAVVDPAAGKIIHRIDLPVARITSCAFGGPGLGDLFITSACVGLDKSALRNQPLAGSVFHVPDIGVKGKVVMPFNG
jgi:sugar lactone lactonase YvrE